jgi:transcriptional antiterminator RfaH
MSTASEQTWDTLCWYVVHTHPKQEERANANLAVWGIETFAPKVREYQCKQPGGRLTCAVKPLFPGYIFANLQLSNLYNKVRFTRGVHSLVSFSNNPYPIDDQIISFIKSRVGKDGFVRVGEDFNPGDEVVIKDGWLKDLTGIFEREMSGANRVMILLKVISYQAHVVVDRRLVSKLC